MIKKELEKKTAIELRKKGKTYSQILSEIPIAKSTLAIWLRSAGLAKTQKQRITELKLITAQKGGDAKRKQRIERYDKLFSNARSEIGTISKRELFLIGTVLYWAEGSKEKSFRPGSQLVFSNMDPKMITVFLKWLTDFCDIKMEMIHMEIYLHKTHAHRIDKVRRYWADITGFPLSCFDALYFKKGTMRTNRKNTTDDSYFGILRIRVRTSSDYVRKLAGWAEGIYHSTIIKYI